MTLSIAEYEMLAAMERRIQALESQVARLSELVGERAGAPPPPVAAERFDVVLLTYAPSMKINVIKLLREVTGLGLAEAKNLSEALPAVVRTGLDRSEAAAIERRFGEAQARVDVRSRPDGDAR